MVIININFYLENEKQKIYIFRFVYTTITANSVICMIHVYCSHFSINVGGHTAFCKKYCEHFLISIYNNNNNI